MKIIILGAGQVGSALAEHLLREDNDITMVDIDAKRLHELQSRLDIKTITGPASYPNILSQAGAADADMIIAVTSSDETNMIGCQVAYSMFDTPMKIARIRSPEYLTHQELFDNKVLPVDFCICPEQLITDHVKRLIDYPGAVQVLEFAEGKVNLLGVKAHPRGPLVGKELSFIPEYLGEAPCEIVAIFRNHHPSPLDSSTIIKNNDLVFFITTNPHINKVIESFGGLIKPSKHVIIAGGGNIGFRLASALEDQYQVKIIDHNQERSELIVEQLNNTTVLFGDAADKELLIDENIDRADVFCAVTNDDETNIMAALQAKRLGARRVMALITRPAYVELIEGGEIDIVISPQQATIGSILTHIRRGDMVNVHSLRHGDAEAIELIAHGDEKTSKVVGQSVSELKLPKGTKISAIVRDNKIYIADEKIIIKSDDHVIMFLEDKKQIHKIEQLFQVNATYV